MFFGFLSCVYADDVVQITGAYLTEERNSSDLIQTESNSLYMIKGETLYLAIYYSNGTDVNVTSSNSVTAEINTSKWSITAKKVGTVTLTATSGNATPHSVTVNVLNDSLYTRVGKQIVSINSPITIMSDKPKLTLGSLTTFSTYKPSTVVSPSAVNIIIGGKTVDITSTDAINIIDGQEYTFTGSNVSIDLTSVDKEFIKVCKNTIKALKCGSTTLRIRQNFYSYDLKIFIDDNNNHVYTNNISGTSMVNYSSTPTTMLSRFYSAYHPEILYIDDLSEIQNTTDNYSEVEDYHYFMWFFGWAYSEENKPVDGYSGFGVVGDAIFHARAQSMDGPWKVFSYKDGAYTWLPNELNGSLTTKYWYPIIGSASFPDKGFKNLRNHHLGDPSVVYTGNTIYMAASATGQKTNDYYPSCIIGLTSTDGIHFELNDEVLAVGSSTGEHVYQRPSLMYEDGKWKMWFDYDEKQVGYVESQVKPVEEFNFNEGNYKSSEIAVYGYGDARLDLPYGVDLDVVKINDIYYAYEDLFMEYFKDYTYTRGRELESGCSVDGYWARRQVSEFTSNDGLSWHYKGYYMPDDYEHSANQVPQIFIDRNQSKMYLMYATQRGNDYSISDNRYNNNSEPHYHTGYDWRFYNIKYKNFDI